jgi:hypothetical protein
MGGIPFENNIIKIGDLKFGQTRDIILKMKFNQNKELPFLNANVKYFDFVNKKQREEMALQ